MLNIKRFMFTWIITYYYHHRNKKHVISLDSDGDDYSPIFDSKRNLGFNTYLYVYVYVYVCTCVSVKILEYMSNSNYSYIYFIKGMIRRYIQHFK